MGRWGTNLNTGLETASRSFTHLVRLRVARARGQFITPLATPTLLWKKTPSQTAAGVALVLGISANPSPTQWSETTAYYE